MIVRCLHLKCRQVTSRSHCLQYLVTACTQVTKQSICWISLVMQWIRIPLPMQGPWVQSLAQEDSTCRGATKPVHHNYWSPSSQSPCSTTSHHNEKLEHHKPDSSPCSLQLPGGLQSTGLQRVRNSWATKHTHPTKTVLSQILLLMIFLKIFI